MSTDTSALRSLDCANGASDDAQREMKRQRQLEANRRYYQRNREVVIEKVKLNQLKKKLTKIEEELKATPSEICPA